MVLSILHESIRIQVGNAVFWRVTCQVCQLLVFSFHFSCCFSRCFWSPRVNCDFLAATDSRKICCAKLCWWYPERKGGSQTRSVLRGSFKTPTASTCQPHIGLKWHLSTKVSDLKEGVYLYVYIYTRWSLKKKTQYSSIKCSFKETQTYIWIIGVRFMFPGHVNSWHRNKKSGLESKSGVLRYIYVNIQYIYICIYISMIYDCKNGNIYVHGFEQFLG